MKRKVLYSRKVVFLCFVLPAILLYGAVVIFPLVRGFFMSLTNVDALGTKSDFVGLQNYTSLVSDRHFIKSLVFTVKYAVVYIVACNVLALTVSIAIDSTRYGKSILRSCFFVPNILSSVIVAFVWKFIFGVLLPSAASELGLGFLENLNLFSNANQAFWTVMFVVIWQNLGFFVVIYTAGLQTIPSEIYEVAKIDGIKWFKKALHIQLPLLMPTITINLFVSIANAFKQFDLLYALTSGGPNRSTETLAYNIYMEAFHRMNLGSATAKGVILLIIILVVTRFQISVSSKREVAY